MAQDIVHRDGEACQQGHEQRVTLSLQSGSRWTDALLASALYHSPGRQPMGWCHPASMGLPSPAKSMPMGISQAILNPFRLTIRIEHHA